MNIVGEIKKNLRYFIEKHLNLILAEIILILGGVILIFLPVLEKEKIYFGIMYSSIPSAIVQFISGEKKPPASPYVMAIPFWIISLGLIFFG